MYYSVKCRSLTSVTIQTYYTCLYTNCAWRHVLYVYRQELIKNIFIITGTFIQPATAVGSSSVCVGSSVTFNCTIKAYIDGIGFVLPDAVWIRNGVVITDDTPRHTLLRTQHEGRQSITGVMVDNTTLDDNGIVYTCTGNGAANDFTSNVTLSVVGGMLHLVYTYVIYLSIDACKVFYACSMQWFVTPSVALNFPCIILQDKYM